MKALVHVRATQSSLASIQRDRLCIGILISCAVGSSLAAESKEREIKVPPITSAKTSSSPSELNYPTEQKPFPVILIESQADAARAQEREAKAEKHDAEDLDAQRRSASAAEQQLRVNWVALILSVFGAFFLGWTLFETRRSAAAAIRAANAAVKSVSIAELGVRPIVVPRIVNAKSVYPPNGPAPSHAPSIRFCWANHGKTPAFLREAKCELKLLSELPETRQWANPMSRVDRTVVAGESDGDDAAAIRCLFGRSLTNPEVSLIRAKLTTESQKDGLAARFFFIGNVIYDDVFGNTHETGFCMKIFADGTQAMRGGNVYNYTKTTRPEGIQVDPENG